MNKFIIYFYKVRIINSDFINHYILLSVFFTSVLASFFLNHQNIVFPKSPKYFNYIFFYALMLYKHILLKTKATNWDSLFLVFQVGAIRKIVTSERKLLNSVKLKSTSFKKQVIVALMV